MPFDGLTIRAVTDELHETLLNARIDKIFQPEKDELIFLIRQSSTGANHRLLISANVNWARIHLDSNKNSNPVSPPSFCMLLRKYLEGGKIKSIEQIDFERIVHITIEALDDFREWKEKVLICEFMGRHSNIILTDPDSGIILDAIKRFGSDVNSFREVLPGKPYIKPPEQDKLNPLTATEEEFSARVWSLNKDRLLGQVLFDIFTGISPVSSRDICFASGLDPTLPAEESGPFEHQTLYHYLQQRLQDVAQGMTAPTLIYKKGQLADYSPFPFTPADAGDNKLTMNETLDVFYHTKWQIMRLETFRSNYQRRVNDLLDKAHKKRFYQEGDLTRALKNDQYRIWGELLTSYAHTFQKGDQEVTLNNFYTGLPETIPLDLRYNPIQNAQKYFKIYNKSRRAIVILEELLKKNAEEIEYLDSVILSLSLAESLPELEEIVEELEKGGYIKSKTGKKGKTRTPEMSLPRSFISSDGLTILVGRNNRQNDLLTLKQADRDDLWFHTRDIPGSHVIVRLEQKTGSIHDVPDKTLEEAAALAAYYSKARLSSKVPVDYTFRSNVKKPGGAKPGKVIYDNYWTIMADPQDQNILGGMIYV
ncbi:MAG: fibronectin/fibrinogen-binding protein [Syntrophomonadaceae bacterium]|jgi:predicted ribosome quality control (RQC) complex YloA/Tae2 family protein|nr:fibronectin/fibrinogen-binding protein [Syntrophomonadaceae bacterium]